MLAKYVERLLPGRVKLIAEGRASEIFDLGGARVLRRFKQAGTRSARHA